MVKPGLFKKALSYLYPVVLQRIKGNAKHDLEVRLENGSIVLNSKSANYSFGSLHKVWRKALTKIEIPNAAKVLVLGAGVGSIRKILHKEIGLDVHLTMVEVDQAVLDLGSKCFDFVSGELLNIVHADAFEYCSSCQEEFDLILIDLFIDLDLPDGLLEPGFWEDLERLSSPRSVLILNTIVHNEDSRAKVNRLRQQFTDGKRRSSEYILQEINHLFVLS